MPTQVALLRDITERKKAEEDLSKAKSRADRLNAEISYFLAFLCHELRNPLQVVIGMAGLLEASKDLSEEDRECQTSISFSAKLMLSIVNDVLDVSRLSSGAVGMELVEFDLCLLLKDLGRAQSLYLRNLKDKSIEWHTNVSPNLPQFVLSDPVRIRQILINLIGNSAKFTSRGSITLNVDIFSRRDDVAMVGFEVIDTGLGVSEQELPKLFKAFSQATISVGRTFGGSGLGLSIVYNLVKLMKGDIYFSSQSGSGTRVLILLPLQVCQSPDATNVPKISNTSEAIHDPRLRDPQIPPDARQDAETSLILSSDSSTAKDESSSPSSSVSCNSSDDRDRNNDRYRILLAEDNQLVQKVAVKLLTKRGHQVATADNGKEAVNCITQDPNAYDLVLMDIQMPVMTGYEATTSIRNHRFNIPIIAVTANAMESDRQTCLSIGFTDYVTKPYSKNLFAVIDQVMREATQQSESIITESNVPSPTENDQASHRTRVQSVSINSFFEQTNPRTDVPEYLPSNIGDNYVLILKASDQPPSGQQQLFDFTDTVIQDTSFHHECQPATAFDESA